MEGSPQAPRRARTPLTPISANGNAASLRGDLATGDGLGKPSLAVSLRRNAAGRAGPDVKRLFGAESLECSSCRTLELRVQGLEEELINVREDAEECERRFFAIQEEGVRLHTTYEAKCNLLRHLSEKKAELEQANQELALVAAESEATVAELRAQLLEVRAGRDFAGAPASEQEKRLREKDEEIAKLKSDFCLLYKRQARMVEVAAPGRAACAEATTQTEEMEAEAKEAAATQGEELERLRFEAVAAATAIVAASSEVTQLKRQVAQLEAAAKERQSAMADLEWRSESARLEHEEALAALAAVTKEERRAKEEVEALLAAERAATQQLKQRVEQMGAELEQTARECEEHKDKDAALLNELLARLAEVEAAAAAARAESGPALREQVEAMQADKIALADDLLRLAAVAEECKARLSASERERVQALREQAELAATISKQARELEACSSQLADARSAEALLRRVSEDERMRLGAELEGAKGELVQLRQTLAETQKLGEAAKQQAEASQAAFTTLQKDKEQLETRLNKKTAEAKELHASVTQLSRDLKAAQSEIEGGAVQYRSQIAALEGRCAALTLDVERRRAAAEQLQSSRLEVEERLTAELGEQRRLAEQTATALQAAQQRIAKLQAERRVTVGAGSASSQELEAATAAAAAAEAEAASLQGKVAALEAQLVEEGKKKAELRDAVLQYKKKGDEKIRLLGEERAQFQTKARELAAYLSELLAALAAHKSVIAQYPALAKVVQKGEPSPPPR